MTVKDLTDYLSGFSGDTEVCLNQYEIGYIELTEFEKNDSYSGLRYNEATGRIEIEC